MSQGEREMKYTLAFHAEGKNMKKYEVDQEDKRLLPNNNTERHYLAFPANAEGKNMDRWPCLRSAKRIHRGKDHGYYGIHSLRNRRSMALFIFVGMICLTFVALSYIDPYAGGMVVANMV